MNDDRQSSASIFHIEICGVIASGKTTLANLLKRVGLSAVLEDFRANPFFELFYSDPVKFAFETEITFSLQHYNQIKVALEGASPFACDFSPVLDLAFADVTLRDSEKDTFLVVYQEVRRQLPAPALLVHLQCSPSVSLERIRARKRAPEKSITVEYLELLSNTLAHRVEEAASETKVVSIRSEELDFATDELDQRAVIDLLRAALA